MLLVLAHNMLSHESLHVLFCRCIMGWGRHHKLEFRFFLRRFHCVADTGNSLNSHIISNVIQRPSGLIKLCLFPFVANIHSSANISMLFATWHRAEHYS